MILLFRFPSDFMDVVLLLSALQCLAFLPFFFFLSFHGSTLFICLPWINGKAAKQMLSCSLLRAARVLSPVPDCFIFAAFLSTVYRFLPLFWSGVPGVTHISLTAACQEVFPPVLMWQ